MNDARKFEATVLPWLDAAYNLARWLMRDDAAAEDVVQEATLRAFRYFESLRGNEARAWFLGIVRNTCFNDLKARRGRSEVAGFEDDALEQLQFDAGLTQSGPAELLDRRRQTAQVDAAIRALPPPMREVIVLREIEGLDYAEIAAIIGAPIGTVMSRLSRARNKLKTALADARV